MVVLLSYAHFGYIGSSCRVFSATRLWLLFKYEVALSLTPHFSKFEHGNSFSFTSCSRLFP